MRPTPTAIREYDAQAPASEMTETATFGVGCFWGPDAQFGALDGVVRTRVGYAGGTKIDPTYHSLGDHTEVFQLDFDPDVVSYTDLLDHVFRSHDPRSQTRKTQYQNIVLTVVIESGSNPEVRSFHSYLITALFCVPNLQLRNVFYQFRDLHST